MGFASRLLWKWWMGFCMLWVTPVKRLFVIVGSMCFEDWYCTGPSAVDRKYLDVITMAQHTITTRHYWRCWGRMVCAVCASQSVSLYKPCWHHLRAAVTDETAVECAHSARACDHADCCQLSMMHS